MKKSKFRRLVMLVLAMLLVFSFVGCSPKAPATTAAPTVAGTTAAPTTAEPMYADKIVIGKPGDASYLDPNQPVGIGDIIVTSQIYEGLVSPNPDTKEIEPQLATDWSVSADGLVYTFNLRPNVKFSDGTPVTGEDWVWSLYRARDAETSSYRFAADKIKTVEATDKQVIITLTGPDAAILGKLCMFNLTVGSKAHWDAVGEEEYSKQPLGTGPYMLKEWNREQYIDLVKNPYYYLEGMPKTNEMQFKVVSDDNTRALQLQSGDIDVMMDVPFSMISQIESDKNIIINIFESTQIRYMLLNTQKKPLDDLKVREAVLMSIDKQELADIVTLGYGQPADSILSATQGVWFNSDMKTVKRDPAAAKKLLADAGYPDGFTLDISVSATSAVYQQLATLLQSQLAESGIKVNIKLLERAALIDEFESLSHQATILQWVDDYPDPSGIMNFSIEYDQSTAWYTGLDDKELQKLNQDANVELDLQKRIAMYHQIQQHIYDSVNIVPLFSNSFVWAANKNVEDLYLSEFYVFDSKIITLKK